VPNTVGIGVRPIAGVLDEMSSSSSKFALKD
jgi:hypothetical protein